MRYVNRNLLGTIAFVVIIKVLEMMILQRGIQWLLGIPASVSEEIIDVVILLIIIIPFSLIVAIQKKHLQEKADSLKAQGEELKKRTEQWKSIFHHNADAIVLLDLEGRVLQVNDSFEKLYGWTQEELSGTPLTIPRDDRFGGIKAVIAEVKRKGAITGYETVCPRKDGKWVNVSLTVSPICDEQGKIKGLVGISRDITQRKQMEKELSESNRKISNILESITDAFFAVDLDWRFTYINQESEKFVHKKREGLIGKRLWDEFPHLAGTTFSDHFYKAMSEQVDVDFEAFYPPLNKWLSIRAYPSAEGLSVYYRDITERKQAEEALQESKERYEALVKLSPDAMVIYSEGKIVFINDQGCKLIGAKSFDEVLERSIFEFIHPDFHSLVSRRVERMFKTMEKAHLEEIKLVRLDNRIIDVEIAALPITYKRKLAVQVVLRDITKRKMVEEKLRETNRLLHQLSTLDGLTGVANRRSFDESLQQEWRRSVRNSTPISLILLDIDYFKAYNDTYGHQAGDECIKKVAAALADTLKRPGDLIARYGGEEFVVILPDTNRSGAVSVAEALRKNVEKLKIPHIQSKVSPYATISVGVATAIPYVGSDPYELLNQADKALYTAKRRGRNRVEVYH